MSNTEIYNIWTVFLKEYNTYLKSDDDTWYDNLSELEIFIQSHNIRPKKNSKNNDEKKMANWIGHQLQNYEKNINNMNKLDIKNDFHNFLIENKEIFKKYI